MWCYAAIFLILFFELNQVDEQGQMGLGEIKSNQTYSVPRFCSYNVIVNQISCGLNHSAFIASNGFVYTMGKGMSIPGQQSTNCLVSRGHESSPASPNCPQPQFLAPAAI